MDPNKIPELPRGEGYSIATIVHANREHWIVLGPGSERRRRYSQLYATGHIAHDAALELDESRRLAWAECRAHAIRMAKDE